MDYSGLVRFFADGRDLLFAPKSSEPVAPQQQQHQRAVNDPPNCGEGCQRGFVPESRQVAIERHDRPLR